MAVATDEPDGSYVDMDFPEKLRTLRKSQQLSQEVLAERVGVRQSQLGKWEAGTGRPYYDQAFKLARALGVSVDYLCDPEMETPSASPGGVELTEGEKAVLDVIKRRGLSWVLLALTDPPIVRAAGQTREQQ
jgi:transcriptional regulator with XRE-family HTH domain